MDSAPIGNVSSGVDYFTSTYNHSTNHRALGLQVARVMRKQTKLGNRKTEWHWNRYSGSQCGGLEWGLREDGAIVRLSGEAAGLYWKRFLPLCSNISRLDLQETYVFDEAPETTLREYWKQMRRWWLERKSRPEPKMYLGPLGPQTIYSGARTSDLFLRLYHRGSRKGLSVFQGHIRFEVEYKAERAAMLARELACHASIDDAIAAYCLTPFRTRGLSLKWSNAPVSRVRVPIKTSDAERCLAWLRKAVRPSVQDMINCGRGTEVLEALGLIEETSGP